MNRLSYRESRRIASTPCRIASISPDGKRLFGFDGLSIFTFDAHDGRLLDEIKLSKPSGNSFAAIDQMAVAPHKGHAIVSIGAGWSTNGVPVGRLELWDLQKRKLIYLLCKDTQIMSSVSISDDGKYVANVMGDNKIAIWDTDDGKMVRILETFTREIDNTVKPCDAIEVGFIPETRTLVARRGFGIQKGEIDNWENAIISKNGHALSSNSSAPLAFSHDGSFILTHDGIQSVVMWDTKTLEIKRKMNFTQDEQPTGFALSRKNDRLGITTKNGEFRVYDTEEGTECCRILLSLSNRYSSITFSPFTDAVYLGSRDGIFCLNTNQARGSSVRFLISPVPIRELEFSADNKKLYGKFGGSSTNDKLAWDVDTGLLIEDISDIHKNLNSTQDQMDVRAISKNKRFSASKDEDLSSLIHLVSLDVPEHPGNRGLMKLSSIKWHEGSLLNAKKSNDTSRILFHLAWLLLVDTTDAWRFDEFHYAYDKLTKRQDNAPHIPSVVQRALLVSRGSEFPRLDKLSAEQMADRIWGVVDHVSRDEQDLLLDLSNMKDVYSMFPSLDLRNLLAAIELRIGQPTQAINRYRDVADALGGDTNSAVDRALSFLLLALAHNQIKQDQSAEDYLQKAESLFVDAESVDSRVQRFYLEALESVRRDSPVASAQSVQGFNKDGSFDSVWSKPWIDSEGAIESDRFHQCPDRARSKPYSMHVKKIGSKDFLRKTVSVNPNTKYLLSAWTKTETKSSENNPSKPTTARLAILEKGTAIPTGSREDDWEQIILEFVTEADQTEVTIELTGEEDTHFWMDDIHIERID